MALALEDVGAIHSGGGRTDAHLAGPRSRKRPFLGTKHLRTAKIGKSDNYHRETPESAVMDSFL